MNIITAEMGHGGEAWRIKAVQNKNMNTPEPTTWLDALKSLWSNCKDLIVPILMLIFGTKWNSWRQEVKENNLAKKKAQEATNATIGELVQSVKDLSNDLTRRDQHFTQQFADMNQKIDKNHEEFRETVKSVTEGINKAHERIDEILLKPKS